MAATQRNHPIEALVSCEEAAGEEGQKGQKSGERVLAIILSEQISIHYEIWS